MYRLYVYTIQPDTVQCSEGLGPNYYRLEQTDPRWLIFRNHFLKNYQSCKCRIKIGKIKKLKLPYLKVTNNN